MIDCTVPALTFTISFFFFFNDPATAEIYTLSLHDALPISARDGPRAGPAAGDRGGDRRLLPVPRERRRIEDRKSTRLNSSHVEISYAVFCLKKKNRRGNRRQAAS